MITTITLTCSVLCWMTTRQHWRWLSVPCWLTTQHHWRWWSVPCWLTTQQIDADDLSLVDWQHNKIDADDLSVAEQQHNINTTVVLLYCSELWRTTEKYEEKLEAFHRKCPQRILKNSCQTRYQINNYMKKQQRSHYQEQTKGGVGNE